MKQLSLKYNVKIDEHNSYYYFLKSGELERFNISFYSLGNLRNIGEKVDVLAAFFDLERFTYFCSQTDPQIPVPGFLSRFLKWLLNSLIRESTKKEVINGLRLNTKLPFFAKFTGDGVLILWKIERENKVIITNIVDIIKTILEKYALEFLPKLCNIFERVPPRLRCGVASGQVVSFGNDYVGPCINIASRLQKLEKYSFAIHKKGIYLTMEDRGKYKLINKPIEGIDDNLLIYVLKKEANK